MEVLKIPSGNVACRRTPESRAAAGISSAPSLATSRSGGPRLYERLSLAVSSPGEAVAFSTPVEATDAIERLASDLGRHARAARAIAEEYFDSDKVLNRLIGEARKA
jgi:hypothetical protein